jgi:dipeptidyl aminopeptidase/acylaminoacyl peptidase
VKGAFSNLSWSPDGRRLLAQFRAKDAEAVAREADTEKKELGIVARHITRLFFKLDGSGYLPKERWHLWTFDAGDGEGRQLTSGEVYDDLSPVWSPDGRSIAFLSNRSPDPDRDPTVVDVFVIPAEGGEPRLIETPLGNTDHLAWSPDGQWLAYIGRIGRAEWWRNDNLWIVPADGRGPARNLTESCDVQVGNRTLGDVADWPPSPPVWSADSMHLYFQISRHGRTSLHLIGVDGEGLQQVIDRPANVGAFSLDPSGERLAFLMADMTDPGQLWLKHLPDGPLERLTAFNDEWLGEVALGEVEEVWFEGAAGGTVQGWIMRPPGFDPGRRYPSIMEIHGGPFTQYGYTFMHEFNYLAGQGYVVYFCNPRGSQCYGEAHSRAIENNWGTADYDDLMAWADYMVAQPFIDPDRMGVTGGSYGGYMTGWIIGHTDRFRAAVAQRVVSNLVSMWGSSDFNWDFQNEFGGRPPWENLANYWRQSPMAHIGRATTPTLVIHSEQDMRCDIEQGLQLYVALKYLGVDSELVLFPDESHGLSRDGRTDRRIVRLEHIARWFNTYLKADAENIKREARRTEESVDPAAVAGR